MHGSGGYPRNVGHRQSKTIIQYLELGMQENQSNLNVNPNTYYTYTMCKYTSPSL